MSSHQLIPHRLQHALAWVMLLALTICYQTDAGELLPGELTIDWGRSLSFPQQPPTVTDVIESVQHQEPEPLAIIRLYADTHNHYAPAWSKSADSLSFLRTDLEEGVCKICVFEQLSDENPIVVYEDFISYEHMPSWGDSDKSLLAFSSNNTENFTETIHLWDLEQAPITLPFDGDGNVLPSVRTNEGHVEIVHRRNDALQETVYSLKTNRVVQTKDLGLGEEAVFSPSGATLSLLREDARQRHQLLLHDRKTAQEEVLVSTAEAYLRNPTWSADGEFLAYFSAPRATSNWTLWVIRAKPGASPQQLVEGVRVHEDFRHLGPAWGSQSQRLWYVDTVGTAGYYPLKWISPDGEQSGVIELPFTISTASDLSCSQNPEHAALTFVGIVERALDVFVLILNHP